MSTNSAADIPACPQFQHPVYSPPAYVGGHVWPEKWTCEWIPYQPSFLENAWENHADAISVCALCLILSSVIVMKIREKVTRAMILSFLLGSGASLVSTAIRPYINEPLTFGFGVFFIAFAVISYKEIFQSQK